MRRLALLIAVVCLISCHGMNAEAAEPTWSTGTVSASHYVGPSKSTTVGSTNGRVGMNAICQKTFGATAHMCNTDEFFETAAFSVTSPPPEMWINPVFQACVFDPNLNYVACRVGWTALLVQQGAWVQTCNDWTSNSDSVYGLAITTALVSIEDFYVTVAPLTCGFAHPVACCAP